MVHRDLAARNVLLSDRGTVKICDFGLSRDVYEQNFYTTSKPGPLPFNWMAMESLKRQVFTTQSDVWSFGVLLWEILALGEKPYQTIRPAHLYEYLKDGYRLHRPALCCRELYALMLGCWLENPAKRPKFGDIRDEIDKLMTA